MSGEAVLRQIQCDLTPDQRGESKQTGQRAFQHTDIRRDAMGEEFQHALADCETAILAAVELGLVAECRGEARNRSGADQRPGRIAGAI